MKNYTSGKSFRLVFAMVLAVSMALCSVAALANDTITLVWYPNESAADYEPAREEFYRLIAKATDKNVVERLTTDYAVVEIDGMRGVAVTMGMEPNKALYMAIIDAACNGGIFEDEPILEALEAEQEAQRQRENALHLKTMVQFHSMDATSFDGSGGAET